MSVMIHVRSLLLPHEARAVVRHRAVAVVGEAVRVVRAARTLKGILECQEVLREAVARSWSPRAVNALCRLPRAVKALRLPGVGQPQAGAASRAGQWPRSSEKKEVEEVDRIGEVDNPVAVDVAVSRDGASRARLPCRVSGELLPVSASNEGPDDKKRDQSQPFHDSNTLS